MVMGVARTKLHPVTHIYGSVMLTQFLGSLIPNFILVGHFINLNSQNNFLWLWPDLLGTWIPRAKILPDWSLINFFFFSFFLKQKLLPVGVAMTKLHPLPCPHVFNNTHLGSRRVYTEFQPFWSKCLAVIPRHKHIYKPKYIY